MNDFEVGRAAFVFSIIDRMRLLNGTPTIDGRDIAFLDSFMAAVWHDRPESALPHAQGAFNALRRRLFDQAAPLVARVVLARSDKGDVAWLLKQGSGRLLTQATPGTSAFEFEMDKTCCPTAWLQGTATMETAGSDIVVTVPGCSARDRDVFLWVERSGADENYYRKIRDLLVATEWTPESGEGLAFRPIDIPFYRRRSAGPMASLFARYVVAIPSNQLQVAEKSPTQVVRFRIRNVASIVGVGTALPTLRTNPFLVCVGETISDYTLDVTPATAEGAAYIQLPATTTGPRKDFWTQPDIREVSIDSMVIERRSNGPNRDPSWEYQWDGNRIVVRSSKLVARTAKVKLRICPDLADAEDLTWSAPIDGVEIDSVLFDPARKAYKWPFSADCLSMEVTNKQDLSTFLAALNPFGLDLRFSSLRFETRLGVDTCSGSMSGAQVIHYVIVTIVDEFPTDHVASLERLLATAIASVATTDAPIKVHVEAGG
ncbi:MULTISPECIES: hypothetical protein [unclassified Rhizobium]|uniref:hypothetical protein n=1 Tax=unclassified Rhizobium TaxID=2613769 RepID=UPI0007EA36AA|nr:MULTISPECIES: hypothetical protein [unclassified Rhizobium]ANM09244.1 hypothetical protein AMK05_CH00815 [Rhizobium sp. N324]OYD02812.1 hypothetical protein AMK08_CH100811 [Rhizobium sp. N4311]